MQNTKSLFQYRSLAPSWALPCLRAQTLYFTAPRDFNDPYDCNTMQPIDHNKLTDKEFVQMLEKATGNPKLAGLIPVIDAFRKRKLTKAGREGEKCRFATIFNKMGAKKWECARAHLSGVACFSESNDNLLMWSHYANKGRGICLEFDVCGIKPLGDLLQVKYSTSPPDVNGLDLYMDGNLFQQLLSCKSVEWKYEREWRLFIFDRNGLKKSNRCRPYSEETLKAVYFGSEIAPSEREKVIATLQEIGSKAEIWQGTRSHHEYKIVFNRLP